jgi:hypothetical protein
MKSLASELRLSLEQKLKTGDLKNLRPLGLGKIEFEIA